ncbi:MAG: hypothetical protein M1503_03080 [Thaumarchaeota archaeon]|nr:hypothetical protein [Nitrososphaerota archaeon]MCL5317235.1 hypothetical protein [Nitrososphaerota archaeon]
MTIWLSERAKNLVKEFFGKYGLDAKVIISLEYLPQTLSTKMGYSPNLWEEELTSPDSKIHKLNLVDGGIEYAINMAESLSKRHKQPLEHYLEMATQKDWIENYIAGYIEEMLLIPGAHYAEKFSKQKRW